TALGLVAAIPAVVIYNHFSRMLAGIRGGLGDLSAGVQQLVSRDLDKGQPSTAGVPMPGDH
ncbi:MAG: tonB-system energizer ExbB, partial [Rhodanobacter sp.]